MDDWVFESRQEKEGFSPPKRSDHLLFPNSLVFRGTNRVVKLISHLDIVPRLRMSGDISPLPLSPSWRGQRQLCLIFVFTHITVLFVKVKGAMNRSGMGLER